jgi:hypothetical protein
MDDSAIAQVFLHPLLHFYICTYIHIHTEDIAQERTCIFFAD